LDFALGWADGLQWLLEAGYKPEGTLELSIAVGDIESTRILLEADGFAIAEHPDVLYAASCSNRPDIHGVVIGVLKKSRKNLRQFALEHLPVYDEDCTGLFEEKVLDSRAVETWERLLHMPIPLPPELHPGHLHTIYSAVHCKSQVGYLDALYDHGFESIDGISDSTLISPIQSLMSNYAWVTGNGLAVLKWFIDKQASLEFIENDSFPNILFYFAVAHSEFIRGVISIHSKSTLDSLLSAAAASCSPLTTDSCSCYCSSLGGCLPLHKIWICNPRLETHEGCKLMTTAVLKSTLENWVQICRLDEAQTKLYYQEMCRLEIFDRLGMAHTCCTYTNTRFIKREIMEDEEQRRLQDEDAILKGQLTAIMKAFEQLRSEYPGNLTDFWAHWWQQVDEILPELIPEERCRCKGLDRRDKKFDALLMERVKTLSELRASIEIDAEESKGYRGKSFDKIIEMHLAKGRSL
jgi:hypothetical protein